MPDQPPGGTGAPARIKNQAALNRPILWQFYHISGNAQDPRGKKTRRRAFPPAGPARQASSKKVLKNADLNIRLTARLKQRPKNKMMAGTCSGGAHETKRPPRPSEKAARKTKKIL
jgi:hypothetical protein